MSERSIRISFDVELPESRAELPDHVVAHWVRFATNRGLVLSDVPALDDCQFKPVVGTMRIERNGRAIY